jgi:phosphoglucosamine mutase
MFGTSGIRGPVGEEVTGQVALSVGRALGVETDRVVVGRDARESGRVLADALAAGLCESGVDVVDVGRAATPTVARGVAWTDADAGVVITASHNPPTDNGIKLWQPSSQAFDAPRRERITERVRSGETALADWDELGRRTRDSLSDRHRRELVESVTLSEPLEVVVDVGNGVGGVTADALDELGCHVQTLNAQQDGAFPGRPSEPTAENCESLSTLVTETDADLGIAHDGDADRMRAVAADGTFLSGDVLLAILARETAGEGDDVAMPVDTSLAVADALAERGIEATYTPVGDVYVAAAASEPGVAFGGEPSGAWIWPAETLCPDGPLAACKLAELAASTPLADRAATIDTYPILRDSVSVSEKAAVMDRVRELVGERYDEFSTLDGIRVERDDAWFLLRASGTEPLVRVTAEARDRSRAQQVFEEATDLLDDAV